MKIVVNQISLIFVSFDNGSGQYIAIGLQQHRAIRAVCGKEHALALEPHECAWLEIGHDYDRVADKLFRPVALANTRDYLPLFCPKRYA